MILSVNPTRMELLKLKRRIAIARRGHKLLRDKQDELMRKFLAIIENAKTLRKRVESGLKAAFKEYIKARALGSPEWIDAQLSGKPVSLDISERKERFLNLTLPEYKIEHLPGIPQYCYYGTTSNLDIAVIKLKETLPDMVELAELELKIKLISEEIKKTRRRVNALEYIFIPNLEETIRYIGMKLSELERSNLTRLMRVKELIGEAR